MTGITRRHACGLLGCGMVLPLSAFCSSDSPDPDRSLPTASGDGATPLHFLSLRDVARLIEARELSPVELTRAMLDRIEAVDGRLKSYATVMAEQAMTAARTA